MHVLRFTLCGNQGLKQRQLNRAHCQLNNFCNKWSVMVSDITVYKGNCLTLDSWTEFVLTSTKTEKAHLKINITTNYIPRLSLQHLQISPLVFTA